MRRLNIAVLSADHEYGQRLLAYIRQSEYRSRVIMLLFTDECHCKERLSREQEPDLLVADASGLGEDTLQWLGNWPGPVLLLREESRDAEEGIPAVEKYQPLNRLLEQMLEHACPNGSVRAALEGDGAFILGVYSAAGGAGKTVFSYVASGLLSRMGYSPLVVTLESVPSHCWSSQGQGEDLFGRVLYETAKAARGEAFSIDRFLLEGRDRKMLLLPGAANPEELEQMSEEDSSRLIRCAAASARADIVVLDLDSSPHPRILAALRQSDKIACLVPDNMLARDKTRHFLQRLEAWMPGRKDRLSFILNGCKGTPGDGSLFGAEPEEALPFQEEWHQLKSVEGLAKSTLYHQRLNNWLAALMNESGRLPKGALPV